MSSSAPDIARRAASRLAGEFGPGLPALTERVLAPEASAAHRQSLDVGIVAASLVRVVQFAWQIYRDLYADLEQRDADEQRKVQVLVGRVRRSLTEPTGLTPQQRDRLVEVVAEEVVASGAAPEEGSRNAAIDRLYAELRQLMSRPGSSADSEIEQKLALLRTLQQKEAAAMRERYIARSPLKPGAGWQALDEARRLLSENENPPSQNPTLPRQA
jgi:hypothetical protein